MTPFLQRAMRRAELEREERLMSVRGVALQPKPSAPKAPKPLKPYGPRLPPEEAKARNLERSRIVNEAATRLRAALKAGDDETAREAAKYLNASRLGQMRYLAIRSGLRWPL